MIEFVLDAKMLLVSAIINIIAKDAIQRFKKIKQYVCTNIQETRSNIAF